MSFSSCPKCNVTNSLTVQGWTRETTYSTCQACGHTDKPTPSRTPFEISYTEFHRRLEAANVEVIGQKVLLKKDGSEPTDLEFAKWRTVLNKHGIFEFDLAWDAGTRSFRMVPL